MVVGVPARSLIGWGGGLDLITSYVSALSKVKGVKVIVFIEKRPGWYTFFRKVFYRIRYCKDASELAISERNAAKLFADIVGKENVFVFNNVFQNAKKLDKVMKKHGVEVCFLDTKLSTLNVSMPKCPYLYDFQHKYLSGFFGMEDRERRDKYFGELLNKAQAVIVEANEVKNDVERFYPGHKAKVFVMPYTAIPEMKWFEDDENIIKKYNLPQNYFIISNQFWMHKDHKTAFEALGKLKKLGYENIAIVCTGKMQDDRNPRYIEDLKECCISNDVAGNVIFLGYIPKLDQIQIMKKSIAAIQPTLFEGNPGGGMGYNAVALKIPIIMSDIQINKELIDSCVTFFQAGNADDLCLKMKEAIAHDKQVYSSRELIEYGKEREKQLQISICEALEYAISEGVS